jgi:hypothetical protein
MVHWYGQVPERSIPIAKTEWTTESNLQEDNSFVHGTKALCSRFAGARVRPMSSAAAQRKRKMRATLCCRLRLLFCAVPTVSCPSGLELWPPACLCLLTAAAHGCSHCAYPHALSLARVQSVTGTRLWEVAGSPTPIWRNASTYATQQSCCPSEREVAIAMVPGVRTSLHQRLKNNYMMVLWACLKPKI